MGYKIVKVGKELISDNEELNIGVFYRLADFYSRLVNSSLIFFNKKSEEGDPLLGRV